jgi:hypothetical protein
VVLVLQYGPRNGDELENNTEIPKLTPRLDKAIAGIGAITLRSKQPPPQLNNSYEVSIYLPV